MACCQDLYRMLVKEKLSAEEIVSQLGVSPSRLKRMLASKRLNAKLRAAELVANKQAGYGLVVGVGSTARKLKDLTGADKPETARRACLDVLTTAREIHDAERAREEQAAAQRALRARFSTPIPDDDWDDRNSPDTGDGQDGPPGEGGGDPVGAGRAAADRPAEAPVESSVPHEPAGAPAGAKATRRAPSEATVRAIEARAAERKRFREEIRRHGGARLARIRQNGR